MNTKKKCKFTEKIAWSSFAFILIGLVAGAIATTGTVILVEKTSTNEFCASCHSHDAMMASFKKSNHGGVNRVGHVAKCVDCHLPHDNLANTLITKAIVGTNDVMVEFFGDPGAINWHKRRKLREEYVYDSGCLQCHVRLTEATKDNKRALQSHKAYFSGELEDMKCVSCHKNVGHKDLREHLDDPLYK